VSEKLTLSKAFTCPFTVAKCEAFYSFKLGCCKVFCSLMDYGELKVGSKMLFNLGFCAILLFGTLHAISRGRDG